MIKANGIYQVDFDSRVVLPTTMEMKHLLRRWGTNKCRAGCRRSELGFLNISRDGEVHPFCQKCGRRMNGMPPYRWSKLGRPIIRLDYDPFSPFPKPVPIARLKWIQSRSGLAIKWEDFEFVRVLSVQRGE